MNNNKELYVVYRDWVDVNGFTRRSIISANTNKVKVMQKFRECSSWNSDNVVYIKGVNLDALPSLIENDASETQIHYLLSARSMMSSYMNTRCVKTKNGITFGITYLDAEARKNCASNLRRSFIHEEAHNFPAYILGELGLINAFDIILDKILKSVKVIMPVTVKVNGKVYKVLKPEQNN